MLSAVLAVLPDQVPARQRGLVSSFTGLSIPLAIVLGTLFVSRVLHSQPEPSYFVIGALFLIIILAFVVLLPDKSLPKGHMPAFNLRTLWESFWINPRQHPNFALVWITRVCVIISSTVITVYMLLYVQNLLHLSTDGAAKHASTFNSVYGIILIVVAVGSGFLSDKLQRRKIFVLVAGLVIALSMFLLAFATTWSLVLVAAAIFGLGYGVYLGVDVALLTEVLPSHENRGKDMGVFNIANSLPQIIVPVTSALTLNAFHNFTAIFIFAGIAAILSVLLILTIKHAR